MTITDITEQKKNPLRVSIFIDGKFAFGLSKEVLFDSHLSINDSISSQVVDDIIEKDQVERLLNKALKFLSFRMRSEQEIRDYFFRKGKLEMEQDSLEKTRYESSIEKVIAKLTSLDQINDKAFAKWWVEQRSKFRPKGAQAIRMELIKKGINKEIIDRVLPTSSQKELALKAASRKHEQLKKLPTQEYQQKLVSFLSRRGFDWETIRSVIDTLKSKK